MASDKNRDLHAYRKDTKKLLNQRGFCWSILVIRPNRRCDFFSVNTEKIRGRLPTCGTDHDLGTPFMNGVDDLSLTRFRTQSRTKA